MTNLAHKLEVERFDIPQLQKTALHVVDMKLLKALESYLTKKADVKKGSNRQRVDYFDVNGKYHKSTVFQWIGRELKMLPMDYTARVVRMLRDVAAIRLVTRTMNVPTYQSDIANHRQGDCIWQVEDLPETMIEQEIGYIRDAVKNGTL